MKILCRARENKINFKNSKHEVRLWDRSAMKLNCTPDDSELACSLNDTGALHLFSLLFDSCNVMQQNSCLPFDTKIISNATMTDKIGQTAICAGSRQWHWAERMGLNEEMSLQQFLSASRKQKYTVALAAFSDISQGSVHGQMVRDKDGKNYRNESEGDQDWQGEKQNRQMLR